MRAAGLTGADSEGTRGDSTRGERGERGVLDAPEGCRESGALAGRSGRGETGAAFSQSPPPGAAPGAPLSAMITPRTHKAARRG